MATLHAAIATLVTRVVRRDHLKVLIEVGDEKENKLQAELSKLQTELGQWKVDLVGAEEDLQAIGNDVARLRKICELHGEGGEDWGDAGGDGMGLLPHIGTVTVPTVEVAPRLSSESASTSSNSDGSTSEG